MMTIAALSCGLIKGGAVVGGGAAVLAKKDDILAAADDQLHPVKEKPGEANDKKWLASLESGNYQALYEQLTDPLTCPNDLGIQNDAGYTALGVACQERVEDTDKLNDLDICIILEFITLLIKESYQGGIPNINHRDEMGNTPLHFATVNGNVSVVYTLLKFGFKHESKDNILNLDLQNSVSLRPL